MLIMRHEVIRTKFKSYLLNGLYTRRSGRDVVLDYCVVHPWMLKIGAARFTYPSWIDAVPTYIL